MEIGLIIFAGLYGAVVSWIEERFGAFDSLSPRFKQTFNTIVTAIVPAIVLYLGPTWSPELGEIASTVPVWLQGIAPLVAAGVAWLMSQVAHYADLLFARFAKSPS